MRLAAGQRAGIAALELAAARVELVGELHARFIPLELAAELILGAHLLAALAIIAPGPRVGLAAVAQPVVAAHGHIALGIGQIDTGGIPLRLAAVGIDLADGSAALEVAAPGGEVVREATRRLR